MANETPNSATPVGERELIVLTKQEAAIRSGPQGLSSDAGADIDPLARLLAKEGATIEPLFAVAADMPKSRSADEQEDARYYNISAPDERLEAIAEELNKDDLVEAAYVKPAGELPAMLAEPEEAASSLEINAMQPSGAPAPAVTPNYIARQGYLNATPEGVDARYAWRFRGGRGAGVRVIDLEWGWRFTHEDLRQNQGGVIAGASSTSTDHGTAVLGEISADDNGRGVIGISPDAHVSAVAFSMPSARAIRIAADNLRAGDIMLLEIHRPGPRFNFQSRQDQQGYIAVEWWPDDFAAIRYAIGRGVVVVEAAGNGRQNFDDPIYSSRPSGFPSTWRNPFDPANPSSQAVVVGAGAPPPGTHGNDHGPDRSRLGFSNYGRRVDAQGWGREVTTTGYGDLQSGDADRLFTDEFSGTSSASPIVVGALACVQGALRGEGQSLLTPQGAINLLRSTGAPQTSAPGRPANQRIGNRPDLKAMIDRVVRPATTYTGVWRSGTDPYYLWANADWNGFIEKWRDLGRRNLRLVDFEITRFGNVNRYSGVWRGGSDAHYLWVNADWRNFVAKWRELGQRNLRLIDIEIRQFGDEWRYSGVWRSGSDPYYLWVNADWSAFVAKWRDLSARNLRLVDFEVVRMGDSYRYSGVWRQGTDAHYLWVNADWTSFVAKWRELAGRNLRLTKIVRTRIGAQWRYSGIWRQGSDSYYLWANASWPNFVDKWRELGSRGLRLVDMEISTPSDLARSGPVASAGGSTMIDANDASGEGYGEGVSGDVARSGLVPAAEQGAGGGDFGDGLSVAAARSVSLAEEASDGAGYGGGEPGEAEMSREASTLAAAMQVSNLETDAGDGYGGGSNEPASETESLVGYGGGDIA